MQSQQPSVGSVLLAREMLADRLLYSAEPIPSRSVPPLPHILRDVTDHCCIQKTSSSFLHASNRASVRPRIVFHTTQEGRIGSCIYVNFYEYWPSKVTNRPLIVQ